MFHKYYGIPKDAKYGEPFMYRFPILFQLRKLSMMETTMVWGIECPIGWYHILEQLCTVLEFYNMEFTKNHGIAIIADQVKEKLGTLRFYFTIRNVDENGVAINNMDELPQEKENQLRIVKDYLEMLADKYISEAEDLTFNTCAECGVPLEKDNKVETKDWITYLCKECDEKIKNGEPLDDDSDEDDGNKKGEGN